MRALVSGLAGRSLDGLGLAPSALGELAARLLDELQVFTFECDRNALHLAIMQLPPESVDMSVIADISPQCRTSRVAVFFAARTLSVARASKRTDRRVREPLRLFRETDHSPHRTC